LAVGGRVISPIEGVKVLVRVQRWLGRFAGRVVNHIPSHNILVCPELLTFEISRKESKVGVGEDVMQLRQNVNGIGLKFLLHNCPVCHSKQQSILLEHREGGECGQGTTGMHRVQEELGRRW
jgi:hypothetical protein